MLLLCNTMNYWNNSLWFTEVCFIDHQIAVADMMIIFILLMRKPGDVHEKRD